jgi:DNA-nicking Smr family endonuclease
VLGWLCEPPLDRLVMAFASAVPEHGGTGATYVLLRRRRGKAEPRAQ